ncbi:hypothetical protein L7F22_001638 [Adiantum nelumboides]|nr:hypothetical protein [Adiantum nelumboides]
MNRIKLHSCSKPSWECLLPLLHAYVEHFCMTTFIARRQISEWYVKPRTLGWWNHYVGFVRTDDQRFRSVFRLPLCLFQSTVELLRIQLQHNDVPRSLASIKGRVLSVEKQVAMGLFRLSTGTTMVAMSELFGVGKSTVVESIDRFVTALLVHRRKYIAWPTNSSEIEKIKAGFFANQGVPNVCGAMDATHIQMEKPKGELGLDWFDRNKNFSMLVQAVVDSDMRFLDVFAGFPGSVNDSRLLKNSALYSCVEHGLILNGPKYVHGSFSMREIIVADGGYPLLPWLMRPYTAPITATEKLFNYKISSTRIVVERAFGLLKMRWRYLHGKVMNPYAGKLTRAIVACCMLQNMCLESGVAVEEVDDMIVDAPLVDAEARNPNDIPTVHATDTRDSLAKFLLPS